MIVEKIQEKDLNQVLQIENENFSDPWPLSSFQNDMNNEVASLYVLKENDEVLGYYDIWQMFENVDIANIAVKKSEQGKGLGKLLMKDLLKRCILNEVEFVHLEVRVSNVVARKMYENFGFEQVRIRKGYYNGEDGIDMMKGLVGLSEEDIGD